MPKYFPVAKTKTVVVEVPVGETGEVNNERLQYDNRNANQKAVEQPPVVAAIVAEANRDSTEFVTAAVLGQATETNKRSVEDINSTVTAIVPEVGQRASDVIAVESSLSEMSRKASDAITATVLPTADVAKRAVEDINASVDANITDTGRKASDVLETVVIPTTDMNEKASELPVVVANYMGYANQNVATTGYATPANALGNNTATAATLTATATGLAGTTSATTNGTLELGFPNPSTQISELGISSNITLSLEREVLASGTVPLNQSYNINYQWQIAGASAAIGSPTSTPTINVVATQTYNNPTFIDSVRVPVKTPASGPVTFVFGFVDADTGVTSPHPFTITGQSGDLILVVNAGQSGYRTNSNANSGDDIEASFVSAGYTVLQSFSTTANGIYYKTHSGSESSPAITPVNGVATISVFRNANPPTVISTQSASGSYSVPSANINVGDVLCICEGGGSSAGAANTARRTYTSVSPAIIGSNDNNYNTVAQYAFGAAIHYYTAQGTAGWTTFANDTGTTADVAKGIVSVTLPTLSYSQLDNLQVRATGTVVSGTGLGASVVHSVYRTFVSFTANKSY